MHCKQLSPTETTAVIEEIVQLLELGWHPWADALTPIYIYIHKNLYFIFIYLYLYIYLYRAGAVQVTGLKGTRLNADGLGQFRVGGITL